MVTLSSDWQGKFLQETYEQLGGTTPPIFNGGIQLWNNGLCAQWALSLETYCQDLMDNKYALSNWLLTPERRGYYRDTFAINMFVAEHKLAHDLFTRTEAVGLFGPADLDVFHRKGCVLFHCFNQNWSMLNRAMLPRRRPSKLIRLR